MEKIDLKIIEILKENSKRSMKDIGNKVNLTGQAVNLRIAKLEEQNIIQRYTIETDEKMFNCHIHAFINIYMHKISHTPYLNFVKEEEKYIKSNYKVVGDGCYLLECKFPNEEHLNSFLERLNKHANYKITTVLKNNN